MLSILYVSCIRLVYQKYPTKQVRIKYPRIDKRYSANTDTPTAIRWHHIIVPRNHNLKTVTPQTDH